MRRREKILPTRCQHETETLSAIVALCEGNPFTKDQWWGEFDVSFDVSLCKLLNKQSRGRWIVMSLWSFGVSAIKAVQTAEIMLIKAGGYIFEIKKIVIFSGFKFPTGVERYSIVSLYCSFNDDTRVHVMTSHYHDVIMGAMASQITSVTIVYSTVYSGADQRKHHAPRHLLLCGEFTGDRCNSRPCRISITVTSHECYGFSNKQLERLLSNLFRLTTKHQRSALLALREGNPPMIVYAMSCYIGLGDIMAPLYSITLTS